MQLLGPLECVAGIVTVGGRLFHRRNLIVGGRLPVLRSIDAELRFNLAQRAFRPFERKLELARLEADQRIAGSHFGSKLHRHVDHDAGDFAAHLCLIGREQRARQIDLPLDRNPLEARCLGGHGCAAAASAASGARVARQSGYSFAARCR